MRAASIILIFCAALSASASQSQFEAASIKPSPPIDSSHGTIYFGPRGGPGTEDPGRYTCNYCDISELVSQAYDVPEYRIFTTARLPGDRFHVIATIPPEATRETFRAMLQNLLADRFKLTAHRESREMQMFRLLVSSGGAKLKPHADGPPAEPQPQVKNRAPGFYYKVQEKTMSDFSKVIEGQLRSPLTDATGLTGKYDFDVWWTTSHMDADAPATTDSPTIFSAIQSLGLKLESRKGPVEVVVVDHVEKLPTEN